MPLRAPTLSIGIEEEYQIIDPKTRELKSYITQFLEGDHSVLRQREIKPEMHQSIVEIGTPVCETIDDARGELRALRCSVSDLAEQQGAHIAAAGTHPFSSWETQEITQRDRYLGVLEEMQHLSRDLLIFGMHVHVGVEDPDFAIDAMNTLRYFLPHVLALSTSSPLWLGRDTGLASYRSALFKRFPRTGVPHDFPSHAAYEAYVDTLIATGCIENPSKIYWDLRPHHEYPTLEFRICDLCTSIDDAICCAAIFQALVLKHYRMRKDNLTFRRYPAALVDENKWRAVRWGVRGNLIDFGIRVELPAGDLLEELVEFLDDVVDDLGSREYVHHVFTILERGTSADRQRAIFEASGDPKDVVDWLVSETLVGC